MPEQYSWAPVRFAREILILSFTHAPDTIKNGDSLGYVHPRFEYHQYTGIYWMVTIWLVLTNAWLASPYSLWLFHEVHRTVA